MGRLNQVIAVCLPAKARAINTLEQAHRGWKSDQIAGMSRTYEPLDDEGEQQPSETKVIQLKVGAILKKVETDLVALYDIVATQDTGNTKAKASIEIDGRVLLKDVPVTMLLFLEKQMAINIIPFLRKLPTLPADREWKYDEGRDCYVSDSVKSNRTQKIPQTHILHPPTTEHPAQCQMYNVDKPVGVWTTTYFSGALPASEKTEMLARAEKLQDALKKAREEANSMEVQSVKLGQTVWNFVFNQGG
jgi:hypothetical protein